MCFSVVTKQPYFFTKTTHSSKEFNSLVPGYSAIGIIRHNNQRCCYIFQMEERRIFHVKVRTIPWSSTNAALSFFILKLPVAATFPANTTISAEHVHHRSTSPRSLKHVGSSNQIS